MKNLKIPRKLKKSKLKDFSEEQFRREYLCEPKIKSLPSIVEFQNGERLEWQPSSKREVEEYIKRCNLQPYIQEPDGNGIAILKLPSLSPEQIKKFKEEWQRFANTSQPITSVATFNPIVEQSEIRPR